MQIDTQPTYKSPVPATDAEERVQIARFHAALFPAKLAMSRWQLGDFFCPLHSQSNPSLRAKWYAAMRSDFQAWLDHGGFSQHDEP